jgi:hypothetical protein
VVFSIDFAALSVFFQLHGESQSVIDYAILSIGCIVLLVLWVNIEADLFPSPPAGTNLSRKAYLTQPGGYFDDPIRFAIGVAWGIPMVIASIVGTWLTLLTLFNE